MVDPGKISDVRYGVEEQSFSYGEEKDIRIHLAGAYQIENAALATEAVQGFTKPWLCNFRRCLPKRNEEDRLERPFYLYA